VESVSLYLQNIKAVGKISGVSLAAGSTSAVTVEVTGSVSGASDASAPSASGNVTLSWPTSSQDVSYGFHDEDYPFADLFEHPGIDINAAQGTAVEAASAGNVSAVYNGGATGASYVMIDHGNGLTTVYGHLSQINVNVGDNVIADTVIGLSGGEPSTQGAGPYTTGAHLHFETRLNGVAADPMGYLDN
jgi:murein DD-endopeptidase MepM/ murein hydrolase activator NlpD